MRLTERARLAARECKQWPEREEAALLKLMMQKVLDVNCEPKSNIVVVDGLPFKAVGNELTCRGHQVRSLRELGDLLEKGFLQPEKPWTPGNVPSTEVRAARAVILGELG